MDVYRNRALLDLARDQACVECGRNDGTVVAAHSNEDKGMGMKTSDATVMFLCGPCHFEYDNGTRMTREERRQFAYRNNAKTLRLLLVRGYLRLTTPKERF
jgi:hypothetical protein